MQTFYKLAHRNNAELHIPERPGKASKPVMLKRGLAATIEEWLMSAEYILSGGNQQVILCERGIRTFETATRNTMDIGAIPVIKKKEPPCPTHCRSIALVSRIRE